MSDCNHEFEYEYTTDEVRPFGEITSIAVFKCKKCGKEFLEGEINESIKIGRSNTNEPE